MKKIVLGLSLFASLFSLAQSEKGLEKVIVEKYYIANEADSVMASQEAIDNSLPSGPLRIGATTYRVYFDLLPGYKILSLYADGSRNQPLIIRSTTPFYNNPNGTHTASSGKSALKNKILALDSYITLGAAATNAFGILKMDDDGTANNVTAGNADGVLLNDIPNLMGPALTSKDGLWQITSPTIVNPATAAFVGFDDGNVNILDALNDGSKLIDSLVLKEGNMYTTGGAKGSDTLTNRVLIAQLTTFGKLEFHLNVLIQKGIEPGQNYVAANPQPKGNNPYDDILFPTLNYPDTTITDIDVYSKKSYSDVQFSVYPNPANDDFTLEFNANSPNSKGFYTIYGLIGNVITHKELNNITGLHKETIDISTLSKGLYTIQLNMNGASSTEKIVKN